MYLSVIKKVTSIILFASRYCSFLLEVNGFRAVNSAGVWRRDQIPLSLNIFDFGHLHRALKQRRRHPLPNLPLQVTLALIPAFVEGRNALSRLSSPG